MITDQRPLAIPFDTEKADQIAAEVSRQSDDPLSPEALSHLKRIVGSSPFLARVAARYPDTATDAACGRAAARTEDLLSSLDQARPKGENSKTLMAELRHMRNRMAYLVASLDLDGQWSLDEVTFALSEFADKATSIALAHALHERMLRGQINWPDAVEEPVGPGLGRKSGFFILGMGKLGGFELNYSSDIDLIALFDPDAHAVPKPHDAGEVFIRVIRKVVDLLSKVTEDGYVFRTDLRLRPDPGATPPALSVFSAESYYQSTALNWERAAMIKARTIAGDQVAGDRYLAIMSNWVWRRSIDFTALNDIAAIKDQVVRHYGQHDHVFRGYDVKLGPGGIREIEFFVQIQQLLFGGREAALRSRRTLDGLNALVGAGRVAPDTAGFLAAAYRDLRAIEHRIQMLHDEQTHTIPEDSEAFGRLCALCGISDPAALEAHVGMLCRGVTKHYDALLPRSSDETDAALGTSDIETRLSKLGYSDPASAARLIEGWTRGRYKALKTDLSRKHLSGCTAGLLKAFANTDSPDATLARFDNFLRELPSGVQFFALIDANPNLHKLIGHIMGLAPALAATLARSPQLWDALLEPDFFAPLEETAVLLADLYGLLASADGYEDVLNVCRRFAAEMSFRIGVQALEGIASVDEAAGATARVADAVLTALIPHVEAEFARVHGRFDGGALAVLALGQYGGGALTPTSDLDLVMVYGLESDARESREGPRPLAPSAYYSRLAQKVVTALTALTEAGRLYEVDMRLRPMGSQGPLAVHLTTFESYYQEKAWAWEHMALTRARILHGPPSLQAAVRGAIKRALSQNRDQAALQSAVADMRSKLADGFHTRSRYALKHVRGGMVDIEFIVQFLILRDCRAHNSLLTPQLKDAIRALSAVNSLPPEDARTLLDADQLYRTVAFLLKLCIGERLPDPAQLERALGALLVKATDSKTLADLEQQLDNYQSQIAALYTRYVDINRQTEEDRGEQSHGDSQ